MKELEELGFSEKETKIYVLLLREKELSAPKIATLLNIERRTVYDTINALFHHGYVSRKKVQGKEVFSAIHPNFIVSHFNDKLENFKKIIPELLRPKEKGDTSHQEVNILYGVRAIQSLMYYAARAKSEIFLMGRGGYLLEQLRESRHQFIATLNSLSWKMIQTRDYQKYAQKKEFVPQEIRYLPKEIKLDVAYLVFDERLYLFTKKKEILLIEIVDKAFADTFRAYFNLFWNIARP